VERPPSVPDAAREGASPREPRPDPGAFVPPPELRTRDERKAAVWLCLVAAAVATSAVGPHDRLTWALDVAPVLVVVPVFYGLRRRVPLTPLVHAALALYSLALALGAHHTFARVPAGLWVKEALDLRRNPFDRFVHLSSGVVGALFLRELLLRKTRLRPSARFTWIVLGILLGLAAGYEILEWLAVVLFGDDSEKFLATQGDEWDSQWDMFCVLLGTCLSLLAFRRLHDRQLAARLGPGKFGPPGP
jgi:putative membrane protein